MTTLSVVLNTCALGDPDVVSSGKRPHAQREYALRNFVIPFYLAHPAVDQLIVAGEWEPGPGYLFAQSPSRYFNCADALTQRQAGYEAANGRFIVFSHDDHLWDWDALIVVRELLLSKTVIDVISPGRAVRTRQGLRELNSGMRDGYINGHSAAYRRRALETAPWGGVKPVFSWDIEHTRALLAAGMNVRWREELRVYDVEEFAEPWK